MPTIIYGNLLPFIALLIVLFFVRINPLFDKNQNKLFFLSFLIILFMLVVISADYLVSLEAFEYGWVFRRITSFLHFSFSCSVPIFLIAIFTKKKLNILLCLPALANLVICFISIFAGLVFILPSGGGYDRGPLFFFPSITSIFYIVVLLVYSIRMRRTRAYEALYLLIVIAGLALALYLEIFQNYKFLSWDFAGVFLILYYLMLNINKSKLDPLTGANNRATYVQKTESLNRSRRCLIAMIDINGFKALNDENGHDKGDKLLIRFVETAKAFTDKKNVLYRIGGDEFAVLSEDASMEAFKARMGAFFEKLRELGICCAVGFESYDPDYDIETAIRSADMKMYEDKRRYHNEKIKD